MSEKIKLALYWGASCGGCDVAVLDTNEKLLDIAASADIVLWPIAADGKHQDIENMADGEIDVCLFNGGVRNSEVEHMAKLLRAKSKTLVAVGACATLGGIPGLANQYTRESLMKRVYNDGDTIRDINATRPTVTSHVPEGELSLPTLFEKVSPLDKVVKVDYYLPGCPPTPESVMVAVGALLSGNLPELGSVIGNAKTLCDECKREKSNTRSISKFHRPHEIIADPNKCLLEQGIVCAGPATRGGCGAGCISANMPCRGCYGPPDGVLDQGAKLLSAVASLIASDDEAEIERIAAGIRDTFGLFCSFSVPSSMLSTRPTDSDDENEADRRAA